jgi:NitT/TauT family transport system substrate-binding protein
MKPRHAFLARCCFIAILVTIAGRAGAAAPEPVTVQLKWVHQAQFAGFYVALDRGYYAEENLDIRLVPGGKDIQVAQSIAGGQADFGVLAAEDILINRGKGLPLKAIAAIYRRSAVVFLSRAGSGITRPQDFLGKTVAVINQGGGTEFQTQLVAMMKNLGLDVSKIHLFPYDPGYEDFYNGSVDITAAYTTGGLITIRKKGLSPNLIWPGDYRVRFYSDTIATADDMIARDPERVTRFLRATLRGWCEAIGNPAAAVDIILKYALIKDRDLQSAMFDAMMPLVHTGEDRIGWMRAEAWQEMNRVLTDQGLIQKPLAAVDPVFSMRFLETAGKEPTK